MRIGVKNTIINFCLFTQIVFTLKMFKNARLRWFLVLFLVQLQLAPIQTVPLDLVYNWAFLWETKVPLFCLGFYIDGLREKICYGKIVFPCSLQFRGQIFRLDMFSFYIPRILSINKRKNSRQNI